MKTCGTCISGRGAERFTALPAVERIESGHEVTQRFSGCGTGRHNHVPRRCARLIAPLPGCSPEGEPVRVFGECSIEGTMRCLCRLHLVGVRFVHAQRLEGLNDARVQPVRPRRILSFTCGDAVHMGDLRGQRAVTGKFGHKPAQLLAKVLIGARGRGESGALISRGVAGRFGAHHTIVKPRVR